MKLRISFKKKVVLVIITVMFFFGTLATIAVYGMMQRTISVLAIEYFESIVIQQEETLTNVFNNSKSFVQHLAAHDEVIKYLQQEDPQPQDAFLLAHFTRFDIDHSYQAIYLMDMTGRTVVSTDPTFVGQNYGFRPYFKKAIEGELVIDSAIGVTSKKFGYYFSHPVKTPDGVIIGVLVAKLKDTLIGDALRPKILSPEGGAMLIDEYGVVIQTDRQELLYKSFRPLSPALQKILADTHKFGNITIMPLQYEAEGVILTEIKRSTAFETYDAQHQRNEIIGIARVNNAPFFILLEEPTQGFVAVAKKIARIVSIFIALASAGVAILLFLLVAKLLKPLTKLKAVASQIGKGNLKQVVTIDTGDEFEELGMAFNNMTAKLNDTYTNLEGKVWERTADFEKFRLAIEAVSDPVIITDVDGRILYANKAMETLTGYTQLELIGVKPSLWGRQMPIEFYGKLWETIKIKKEEFHGEITNKRKGGERYLSELHISPLLMNKGKLYGFVSIQRDITARREADKTKNEFISIASHQLRTPLTVINWYTQMLSKGEVGQLNNEQQEYLGRIQSASKRMVDLINSLLSVSRVDLGALNVKPEQIQLTEIADSILVEMGNPIEKKQLHIVREYDPQASSINADPALVRIIFQNLILNAIQYTPEKGIITIGIARKGIAEILITVADNGYGIPVGQQARIFEKFFRADNAQKEQPEGNGLGLYIVKSILELIGGTIWFESEENKGSTFYAVLPNKKD
ncbi:MAG: Two-component sensor kinase [Candidatus Wolfebacteria bacterium GW2011_GWC2_46_275]|nr:MAG: Two-component sensor kinase [Candidatus Wolfebacteria bacterium GW2011_GWC2_46_275]KKU42362.1 MAG: Two-component sensor kinase [Candidatus Wolfebacteria bacterium GW2011_GWB2_46_69]KKU54328.1 MAG: Two-component sensor kinase [Candidatus Wolfebacteria bacterium GW2011_GWC1_47_103]KKU59547.1 MAG: Two-component sensor kinase [Candidatus Wolfebacteria bacterium GW2011_GWE2_47_12]KKU66159.1 MAG: Two-component sensor kinase [Candidatus Wolfebacteria bacterium GW2011_GWD2_47_17]KKU72767.1 MAG